MTICEDSVLSQTTNQFAAGQQVHGDKDGVKSGLKDRR